MIAGLTPKITVAPHALKTLAARHPWVRAGSIERIEGDPTDGGEVDLYSHKGRFIGRGLYNGRSRLRVRLYRWDAPAALDRKFWEERIARAVRLRQMIGYDDANGAARVVYSEGDGLSGLIVDRYRDYLVVQVTGLGIAQRIDTFLDILQQHFSPKGIVLRTEPSIAKAEGLQIESGTVRGKAPEGPILIEENGVTFRGRSGGRTQNGVLPRSARKPCRRSPLHEKAASARRLLLHRRIRGYGGTARRRTRSSRNRRGGRCALVGKTERATKRGFPGAV